MRRQYGEALMKDSRLTWNGIEKLMPAMRRMARRILRRDPGLDSYGIDDLVHSGLRRLHLCNGRWAERVWKNPAYFFGALKRAMVNARQDHHRYRDAAKRIPHAALHPLEDSMALRLVDFASMGPEQLVEIWSTYEAVDRALQQLTERHPKWAEIFVLVNRKYLSIPEAARVVGCSERQARRLYGLAAQELKVQLLRDENTDSPSTV
jgi:DNA-directed RNA polymerase specialized sigma24 family protein